MSSAAELQKAIFEALGASAALTDLIGARTSNMHRRASLIHTSQSDARASMTGAQATKTRLSSFSHYMFGQKGKDKEEMLVIMDLARQTLYDAALDLGGHGLMNLRLEYSEARYDDRNEAHHGLLRFRAVVEDAGH